MTDAKRATVTSEIIEADGQSHFHCEWPVQAGPDIGMSPREEERLTRAMVPAPYLCERIARRLVMAVAKAGTGVRPTTFARIEDQESDEIEKDVTTRIIVCDNHEGAAMASAAGS